MSNVSLIDGHIDNVNRCVVCNKIIPEGRQVCYPCQRLGKYSGEEESEVQGE